MSAIEVACVGLATADTIVSLPGWPEPDGRVIADAIARSGGGPAATAAVTLARLGHTAALIGAVGGDAVGERIRADLRAEGVDVNHLATLEGRSAESVILLDRSAASRTILHAPGVELVELPPDAREAAAAATWIHVDQGGYPASAALDRGRLSVDAGHRIEGLELDNLAIYAPSVAALGERYPKRSLTDALLAAREEGARRVVVTLGADGAVAVEAARAWRVAAPPVDVVSTLGAGDVFHGALLAALLDGRSLADAVRWATVAGSLSCRGLDGRSAIPDRAELEAALSAAPPVEPMLLDARR